MNDGSHTKLVYFRELALLAFAIVLLAAAPAPEMGQQASPQPVNVTVPADQATTVQVNRA